MSNVKNKLISDKGASITFALLLFLICAVISSVVVVAGTTAAGRMAGMATSEQQYYAVTSAAKLIQGELEGKSATVIKVNGNEYVGSEGVSTKIDSSAPSLESLPDYIAYKLCNQGNQDETGDPVDPAEAGGSTDTSFTLSLSGDEGSAAELPAISVDGLIDRNGTVTLTVGSGKAGKRYEIKLVFTTSEKKSSVNVGQEDGSQLIGKRTTYTWNLERAQAL